MKSKIIIILVVVILVLCGVLNYKRTNTALTEPFKIGSITALTGVGVAPGEEERKGAQLAVDEINSKGGVLGRPFLLIAEDLSLDKMKNATSVTRKLIDVDQVIVIVGAQWDEPSEAIIPVIESSKVPTISADATNHVEVSKDAPYFFSTWYDNRVGIRTILEYAKKKSLKNISIIRPVDGGFWKYTADLLTEYAPEYGVKIISDEDLGNPLTTDFRTIITKTKALKPDAVFIVETDPAQCAFAKQARELGLTVPILATEAAGNYDSLGKCADLLTTTYFSTPVQTDSYTRFEKLFKEKYGNVPQYPSSVTAYDAVYVIAHALEKTKGQGGNVLRAEIAKTKDLPGASLPFITLDEKGYLVTSSNAFEMQTVRGGKFVKAE